MSRDAKIGIVVILIIVGLLVVIWGRGDKKEEVTPPAEEMVNLPPPPMPTPVGVPTPPPFGTPVTPTPPTGVPGAVTITPGLPPVPTIGPTGTPEVVPPITPEPVAPTTTEYTVKANDSLALIAREQLGSEARWQEIAKLNNLAEPYRLSIGQKLKLPSGAVPATIPVEPSFVDQPPAPVRTAPVVEDDPGFIEREGGPTVPIPGVVFDDETSAPTDSGTPSTYVVKSGDTLFSVARDVLKDPAKWKKIAELNDLTEPYALKVGQELLLPQ